MFVKLLDVCIKYSVFLPSLVTGISEDLNLRMSNSRQLFVLQSQNLNWAKLKMAAARCQAFGGKTWWPWWTPGNFCGIHGIYRGVPQYMQRHSRLLIGCIPLGMGNILVQDCCHCEKSAVPEAVKIERYMHAKFTKSSIYARKTSASGDNSLSDTSMTRFMEVSYWLLSKKKKLVNVKRFFADYMCWEQSKYLLTRISKQGIETMWCFAFLHDVELLLKK